MKTWSLLFLTAFTLSAVSCGESEAPAQKAPESLVDFKDGIYTEYYPGRKAVKFKGPKDENGQRHGMWFYYSENGTEQSMTEYQHGKKHGSSFARYPSGGMRYFGDWKNDEQVGVWITYNEDGTVAQEKDYGQPETTAEAVR